MGLGLKRRSGNRFEVRGEDIRMKELTEGKCKEKETKGQRCPSNKRHLGRSTEIIASNVSRAYGGFRENTLPEKTFDNCS